MTACASRVTTVLLNWNSASDTVACVDSLGQSAYPNQRLVVIDNGSDDNSLSVLRSLADRHGFRLVETGDNLGFPGACNVGIRLALADGADYVFLLNNDTEIAPEAIGRLVDVAERATDIAIVTPKILFFGAGNLVWYGGAAYDRRHVVGRQVGYKLKDDGSYNEEADVPWATGCAMLIKRQALEAVGVLNEDYFFGTEDLDYSLRVTARGYRIRYVPGAIVWHKEAAAAGGRDVPLYVYYQVRNVLLLRRTWAAGFTGRVAAMAFSWAWIAKRSAAYAARARWRCLLATIYGVSDHLRRAYGRREHPLLSFRRSSLKSA